MEISIIIPAYNEQDNVIPLYEKLTKVLKPLKKTYEIIFIDDGSTDNTFKNLKEIKDKNLRIIQFQSNFQKAEALSAGFNKAKGEIIITMDADLQDNPEEIPRFLEKLKTADMVVGWKYKRKDPITKIIVSRLFNLLVRILTKVNIHDSDCNFRAIRKEVIKNIHFYSGLYRYIPSIAKRRGFKIDEIKVVHYKRRSGKSKYGLGRLFFGFFDLLTIKFLISYNKRPMHFFGGTGILMTGVGLLIGVYLLYVKYILNELIGNRPLLILSLLLIVLGIQFISTGLIGEMITSTNHKKGEGYIIKRES